MRWYLLVLCLCYMQNSIENAKILGVFPLPGKSHFIMFEKILLSLAERGHEVDVLGHFPLKKPVKGYTDISLVGTFPFFTNNFTLDMFDRESRLATFSFMFRFAGNDNCEATFNSDVAKNLRNSTKKYDLVLTELFSTDCMLGWGYRFGAPIVALSSSAALPWANDRFGNPDNPAYIAALESGFVDKMTLYERVVNTFNVITAKWFYSYLSERPANRLAKQFFGEDMPDLNDLAKNISLFLVNSHFSVYQARPTVPNFVEVGGVHLDEPKPLDKYFQELLTTDSKGIIYFSMGSMVLTEALPKDLIQGIFDGFAELPYKIIWKAVKENFPKELRFPKNIHFERWIPQFDILCHPNVKLFVSHGGLMGTQEALYCGVPRIGIPLFADQEMNIRFSTGRGMAIKIDFSNITKESILEAATEILNNPEYQENARLASERFKDRPLSPLNTSLYWIEYVIRHKGAHHLRSTGADLPWYQYNLLDVGAIFVLIPVVLSYLLFFVFKLIFTSTHIKKSKSD